MSNKRLDKVRVMESVSPPVEPIEALRRNLLYAMLQGVTNDDMDAIVKVQVEKAKEGDGKAARLLIDMVQSGIGSERTTHMQQAIVVDSQRNRVQYMSEARRQIVSIIAKEGPQPSRRIAELLHMDFNDCCAALDHDEWFEKSGGKYGITQSARIEVVPDPTKE